MDTETERKWQRAWKEKRIFEPVADFEKKKFFFTVPYPYTSGTLHVGHGRTYTLGDITARFMRMRGFNVLWPLGFHITGTPILAISKRIANNDKGVIEEHEGYVSLHDPGRVKEVVSGFKDPNNVAKYYASVISKDMDELGCSIDWRRDFTTGDAVYNQFIKWQYHHLNALGYLKRGEHPVFYCPSDGNPVTTDDVKGGDETTMTIEKFFLIKEKFEDGFLVAATLRPETVFGVTNVWVNENASYVKADVGGETWYVSGKAAEKLSNQNMKISVLERMKGRELMGKDVVIPLAGNKVKVFHADFVDDDVATGIVNSVPAHAPYDYVAMKAAGINTAPVSVISVNGENMLGVTTTDSMKIKYLNETEKLDKATKDVYAMEFYKGVTNKGCGSFSGLTVSDAKQKIFDELVKRSAGGAMYENASTGANGPVKAITCRCGSPVVVRVLKDQWFLNYADPYWKKITRKLLSSMDVIPAAYRKQFEGAISWIHEWACARHRGLGTKLPYDEKWIIESLSDSTIYTAFYTIAGEIKKNGIKPEGLNTEFFDFVFLGKGDESAVAKATGVNRKMLQQIRKEFAYWYPLDERRTAPAHIPNHLTFFLFHHAAIFPETLWPKRVSINELLVAEGRKMSKSLGNVIPLVSAIRKHGADTVRLYLAYSADAASTLDWREAEVENLGARIGRFYDLLKKHHKPEIRSLAGKWLVNEFYRSLGASEGAIRSYGFRSYVQKMFFDMLRNAESVVNRTGDYGAVHAVVRDWILALSPIMPHVCEELWKVHGGKGLVSEQPWPAGRGVERRYLELERMFSSLVKDMNTVLKLTGGKKARIYAKNEGEKSYIEESADYLKSTLGLAEVKVYLADESEDRSGKAAKAKPGRPGIYME